MLEHLHSLLSSGHIAIARKHNELITSLRTAHAEEWKLDKEETVFDDDLDTMMTLVKGVK